ELCRYDADLLNAMYVTPHRWTQFASENSTRLVVQPDLSKWDYRHQVLGQSKLRPWQVFVGVKWLEFCFHLRPRQWLRCLRAPGVKRRQIVWCFLHTVMVWLAEIAEFLWQTRFSRSPISLAEFQNSRGRMKSTVQEYRRKERTGASDWIPGD